MFDSSFLRYLPPDSTLSEWGWNLLDAGQQDISPHGAYPMPGHPRHYLFDNEGRRTLDEYQLVLISSGQGWFESQDVAKFPLKAGMAFLLFPGHWHRYAPDSQTGWSERWLGFRGPEADRVLARFFSPKRAVHRQFDAAGLQRHFESLFAELQGFIAGREQVLASYVPLALAHLQAPPVAPQAALSDELLVARVKMALAQDPIERVNLPRLAKKLGVSYSRLRFAFRDQTGYSPREYENLCRLNRACDRLRRGEENVTEIANQLGFSSAYYFSRAFKKQFGVAPSQWKNRMMAGHARQALGALQGRN